MIQEAFLYGGLVTVLTSVLILASLAHNPRIWLGDAPQEMQDALPPLSKAENRLRGVWSIPIIGSMLLLLPLIAIWRNQFYDFSYFEGFVFLWIGLMLFNLVDLVIIDWIIIVWWQPTWTTFPDAAHLMHTNTFRHHFNGFLTGCALVTGWSAFVALLFLWV
jgi:hypothetical protein